MKSINLIILGFLFLFSTACSDKENIAPVNIKEGDKGHLSSEGKPKVTRPVHFEIQNEDGSFLWDYEYDNSHLTSMSYSNDYSAAFFYDRFKKVVEMTGSFKLDTDSYREIYKYTDHRLSHIITPSSDYKIEYNNFGMISRITEYQEDLNGKKKISYVEWFYNGQRNLFREIYYVVDRNLNSTAVKEIKYEYDSNKSIAEGVDYIPTPVFPRVAVGFYGLFWSKNNVTKKTIFHYNDGTKEEIRVNYWYNTENKPEKYIIYDPEGEASETITIQYQ